MTSFWTVLTVLPLPVLVISIAMTWFVLSACALRRTAKGDALRYERALTRFADLVPRFDGELPDETFAEILSRELEPHRNAHPAVEVLAQVLEEPQLAADDAAIAAWTEEALERAFGDLSRRLTIIGTTAPNAGYIGTVLGLAAGAWIFAQTTKPQDLVGSIAIALVTSLLGGVAALIANQTFQSILVPARQHAQRECAMAAAIGRTLVAETGSRADRLGNTPIGAAMSTVH